MHPFTSLIALNKDGDSAIFLQVSVQIANLIKQGILPAGHRLPSTRDLAKLLGIHRKTVIRAYDELLAQGWLESHVGSGTFVAYNLPEINPRKIIGKSSVRQPGQTAGFGMAYAPHLNRPINKNHFRYHLDDGFPDSRLAPLRDLSRAYRTQLLMGNAYHRLGYADPGGTPWLREELSAYLNQTRALNTRPENILITRGSVMGLYLSCTALLEIGDKIVVGVPTWGSAATIFKQAGAQVMKIRVDAHGLCIDELRHLCQHHKIRMVYVTSHHHYPSTVSLKADRRMALLKLAEQYGFILFEDDYDYDFHYENKPLLPLASADEQGMVLYCGSFTKTLSPAFRIGYVVGPANAITHLAKLRRFVDRQGDTMLENAMAELLQNGIIQRHVRKSLRAYRERRDIFCKLLKDQLGQYVNFQIPEGGLAVWAKFDESLNLGQIAKKAALKDLYISNGSVFKEYGYSEENGTRLGFASSTPEELHKSIEILERSMM
ncbi:PLP-dependent aminotransferase family protein [Olivibacter sitiensis]|uniref:MocR-like pyridoxine biosynthesis transcription factor PdxR n=1 Tax=Olivibacter sitiensis TaxID=376470 RepID=UPI0004251AA5|nr:PLP-dependent aminotransferase family protein [Olivibacter sitiensis]